MRHAEAVTQLPYVSCRKQPRRSLMAWPWSEQRPSESPISVQISMVPARKGPPKDRQPAGCRERGADREPYLLETTLQ